MFETMLQYLQGRFRYVNMKQLLGNVPNDRCVQVALSVGLEVKNMEAMDQRFAHQTLVKLALAD